MKIGFIGVGHMARSIALAITDVKDSTLLLCNRTIQKAIDLQKKIQNSKVSSFEEVIQESDIVFLGVKPIDLFPVLDQIKELKTHALFISMVAGISIEQMQERLDVPYIRILPNTPVAVKKGLTLYRCSEDVTPTQKETFLNLMKGSGEVTEVEEKDINLISVLTSSAPAYLNYFIDALIQAGVKEGLKEDATYYVLKMIDGTIALDLESEKSPLTLGKEVCSPKGSTIEGVQQLLDSNLYEMVSKAVRATYQKNNKMI
ncbi:MAG: pyrroline-5-carboxylate reductase [Bacilli bacterium]|nr:pyrroline-5-carboxylate reductase [Bacilli bacterium]